MGNFSQKWEVFWETFWEYDGYQQVLTGLRNTVAIAVVGLALGIFIGTVIAAVRVMPKYKRLPRILDAVCDVYTAFFRGTPMVVQLLLGYYVLFPLLGVKFSSLATCMIIFGLNSGAYVSEIMRGGIQSVDIGQTEAGRAMGLSYPVTMLRIVVPQAIKNILPTLGNEFITLIKETSVVSFVGAVDLFTAFRYIGANNYEYMVPYLVMALIYIVMIMMIALGVKLLERRMGRSDRRS